MKTYQCPYCDKKLIRDKLVSHIEKYHDEEVPDDYTPYRLVYDIVNDKQGHGNCTICGKPTKWNEKRQKYERLCGNPKCYEAVKKTYQKRMMRVYNKVSLMDDPHHLENMLAHRKISGRYKWSDGKIFTYTGKYEKNLMEFLDKTLEFKSNEILAPGPILEYEFQGKKHKWITDFLILPYNLIIEVKDGGDNPNNRFMPVYRAKQAYKEKMITSLGVYSYLRLTNNDFGQLLGILAELKMKTLDDTDKTPLYRIHEDATDFSSSSSVMYYSSEGDDAMNEEVQSFTSVSTYSNINGKENSTKEVFNLLSDKEKEYVSPHEERIANYHAPVVMTKTEKVNGKDAGYIQLKKSKDNTTLFVTIAVSPQYRGKGLSEKLIKAAKDYFKNSDQKMLLWRCDADNIASRKTAEKNGFKLHHKTDEQYTYCIEKTSLKESVFLKPKNFNTSNFNIVKVTPANRDQLDAKINFKKYDIAKSNYEKGTLYILFDKLGIFIGTVCVMPYKEDSLGWIVNLYVEPKYRGKGIGSYLLHYAMKQGGDVLSVDHKNTNAINLYLKNGFKTVAKNGKYLIMLHSKAKPSEYFLNSIKNLQEAATDMPILISDKDVEYNVDKWKEGKIKVLFVTGMSGGGKSVLSHQLAVQYHATHIQMDHVYHYLNGNLRDAKPPMIDEWFMIAHGYPRNEAPIPGNIPKQLGKDSTDYITWVIKKLKGQIVIEGLGVVTLFDYNKDLFDGAAVIIKGTSLFTSFFRRVIRDRRDYHQNAFTIDTMRNYKKWLKYQNKFRADISQYMLREYAEYYDALHNK